MKMRIVIEIDNPSEVKRDKLNELVSKQADMLATKSKSKLLLVTTEWMEWTTEWMEWNKKQKV